MRKILNNITKFFENREIIVIIVTVIVGIIYILQLVNLQIINGKEYREKSEKKMLRNETIVAPRGEIYDRNGVILATNKLSFDLMLYKVKVDDKKQTEALVKLINILESNNDKIYSTFPITDDFSSFNFENEEAEKKWKQENKLDENANIEGTIDYFINKYNLKDYDRQLAIKIIKIKYEANLNGYSLFKAATIGKNISQNSVAKIEENKSELYGVETISMPKRYYPNGTLAAHAIGYVSKINNEEYENLKDEYSYNSTIGKFGIEQTFEKYLKGQDGVNKLEVDSVGTVASENISKEPVSGNNVTLTIDYRLQKVAEEALKNTISDVQNGTNISQKFPDANAGAVVVVDTLTGEVLAMASYPTFDLNQFVDGISTKDWNALTQNEVKPMVNRVISGMYSPGSTFKMLVALAGLQNKSITETEKILDTGIYAYGHHPKCWLYSSKKMTHGYINVSQAIKVSCNVFFYEVGRRLGIDKIIEYAKLFELNKKTGIELKNEAEGKIAGDGNQDNWYLGDTLSAAIGQSGNSYTPIELVNYISAVANGGNLNKLTLIKNVQDNDQNTVSSSEISEYLKQYLNVDFEEKNLNLNPAYVEAVKEGMLSVTSEVGGTSYIVFKNSNIQVAGKTGTSQVTQGSDNGIFVGFAPYDKPRIAVVAIIEHGGEGTYTANVVKPIMEEYFNITKQDSDSEKTQETVNNNVQF